MDAKPLTLTERRKRATQLDIARAAALLFAQHGADQVTVETIAAHSGVSLRTFYRYFRSKEDAIAPLLGVGADRWQAELAATDTITPASIEAAIERVLTPPARTAGPGQPPEELGWMRGILRAGADDAALLNVWYRVNRESEAKLAPILTERMDASAMEVRLVAAAATAAIRIAFEVWADTDAADAGPGSPAELARTAFLRLSAGLR